MPRKRRFGIFLRVMTAAAVLGLVFAAVGCKDDDPAGVQTSAVTLSEAKIQVGDQSLDGLSIRQGEAAGTVRFEARLTGRDGHALSDYRVRVRVDVPHRMGSMHPQREEFFCYDDGTHGDRVPGDGVYCYEDELHQYGCHRAGAQHGEYHYEFCGVDGHGHESNRMTLKVNLLP